MARGRFISFEGVDGAGKSTQVQAVAAALAARAVPTVVTREPGGTALGEAVRAIVLAQPMTPMTETLLMHAARSEHVHQVIAPTLAAGTWVLCDRFADASFAYQGRGRGVAADRLETLANWVQDGLVPDLSVLVDIAPAEAQRRREQARAADRFERESRAFFERVREAYLARARAEPHRFLVLDGGADAAVLTRIVIERLAPWLR